MWTDAATLVDAGSAGDWIRERLRPPDASVGSVAPTGFETCVRILHGLEWRGRPARWADVASEGGKTMHPLVQFRALAAHPSEHGEPFEGGLTVAEVTALSEALERHTTTPDDVWFALWNGFGQLNDGGSSWLVASDGGETVESAPALLTAAERGAATLSMPMGRDYLVFRGPLSAIAPLTQQGVWEQSPNLWWPADRAWCVATEIDFDSTLVSCSLSVATDLLNDPRFEAFEVDWSDSLMWNADTVNLD